MKVQQLMFYLKLQFLFNVDMENQNHRVVPSYDAICDPLHILPPSLKSMGCITIPSSEQEAHSQYRLPSSPESEQEAAHWVSGGGIGKTKLSVYRLDE